MYVLTYVNSTGVDLLSQKTEDKMAKEFVDEKMEELLALETRKVEALEKIASTLEKLDSQIRAVNPAEMKKRARAHKKKREALKRQGGRKNGGSE